MSRSLYHYRCKGCDYEYVIPGPEGDLASGPDVTACPQCDHEQSWYRSAYQHRRGLASRRTAYTSELRGETAVDQAVINVANHIKSASAHAQATAEQWTDKERKGYAQRKAMAEAKDRSLSRGDRDARMVGEIPARLERKMREQSGDPQYWTRNNCENMKRHGLYWGKR